MLKTRKITILSQLLIDFYKILQDDAETRTSDGLRGVVLQWLSSYLFGRTFQVVYGGSTSSTIYIPCFVPQGSVLGPRLFILYTADLEDHVHAFTNNTQPLSYTGVTT